MGMGVSSVLTRRLYRTHQIIEIMTRAEHACSFEA
jgi:hypothetical protein